VVASVAYVDPGNFATNIQGGATYGYSLLWVVVLANLVAMLFQGLSARLGIVSGANLAELCRAHYPRRLVWAMWGVSEVAAMATDLAEFVGASIGLTLLLGTPLVVSMLITAVITYGILLLDRHGFRPLEIVISAMIGVIALSYLAEVIIAKLDWAQVVRGTFVPGLADGGALTLAVGIIGATVMPHAIYLHSSLTQGRIRVRDIADRDRLVRMSDREVLIALAAAGLVNMAMLSMAAAVFHATNHTDVADIATAYRTLQPLLGPAAAAFFMVALLASGLSSSVVGTLAGQVIMQGFIGFRVPLWLRRLVTMLPAFAVVLSGTDPTRALVLSQVVLSLVLPVPMIALVHLSARGTVMGSWRLRGAGLALSIFATVLVLGLNVILLAQIAGLELPFFG
jgi:manganese transport protein